MTFVSCSRRLRFSVPGSQIIEIRRFERLQKCGSLVSPNPKEPLVAACAGLREIHIRSTIPGSIDGAVAGFLDLEKLILSGPAWWVQGGAFRRCEMLGLVDARRCGLLKMYQRVFSECVRLTRFRPPKGELNISDGALALSGLVRLEWPCPGVAWGTFQLPAIRTLVIPRAYPEVVVHAANLTDLTIADGEVGIGGRPRLRRLRVLGRGAAQLSEVVGNAATFSECQAMFAERLTLPVFPLGTSCAAPVGEGRDAYALLSQVSPPLFLPAGQ